MFFVCAGLPLDMVPLQEERGASPELSQRDHSEVRRKGDSPVPFASCAQKRRA